MTKPKNATGRLPAILFVAWLSCATVELTDGNDSWTRMLRDVAEKTGAVVMRVEKPGVGDSEGIACADCDLEHELNGYRAALRMLKNRQDVDTTRIILFGASLGGSLAPMIGKGHSVKAYVSAVSVYKTWLEHMIDLERRRLVLSGKSQRETSVLMPEYIEFHTRYLLQALSPREVARAWPHLNDRWYDQPEHQYGRPARFYHQLQRQNFFQHWAEVTVPVLVIAGEYDWIMDLEDSQLLADELNSRRAGQVSRMVGKGMDHHWNSYTSASDAFVEKNGVYDSVTVAKMVDWMKQALR
ncbi:MAG: alpha/beta hydrolase [Cyclobacteriaceae bacterium]|nr:alpha/beta hydrolase [Cyclobacteriaceae bacterium]